MICSTPLQLPPNLDKFLLNGKPATEFLTYPYSYRSMFRPRISSDRSLFWRHLRHRIHHLFQMYYRWLRWFQPYYHHPAGWLLHVSYYRFRWHLFSIRSLCFGKESRADIRMRTSVGLYWQILRMDHRNEEVCRFLPTSEFLWNRLHIHMLPPIQVSGRYRIPNHRHDKRTVRYVCPSRDLCLLQRYIASGRYILRYHRYLSGTYHKSSVLCCQACCYTRHICQK